MAGPLLVKNLPKQGRVARTPEIRFNVKTRPWQIQPIFIHPVIPGETIKNIKMQARVVTDPIKNALIGWHQEYYFFYVKLTDLDGRDDFKEMMLDAEKDMSAYNAASDPKYFHVGGGIPWAKLCLKRVVEEFFRDEGEAWDLQTIDGLPVAATNFVGWWESATDTTLVPDGGELPEDADNTTFEQMSVQQRTWEYMRTMNLTNMDWEDWLATYGVRPERQQVHKPELLRYLKDWTYPSNTVDPATGIPSSACSWSIGERADKDRFIKEPGFVLGVSVTRPKVYYQNIKGTLTSKFNNAFAWLPALLRDDPATSLFELDNATSPLGGTTNDHWVDFRDLLVHGEQFLNYDLASTVDNIIGLPTAAVQTEYPAAADADELFAGANKTIRQDGIVQLVIMGTQRDQT